MEVLVVSLVVENNSEEMRLSNGYSRLMRPSFMENTEGKYLLDIYTPPYTLEGLKKTHFSPSHLVLL